MSFITFTTATRFHDFCYGHAVWKHESKCKHLHGHGGRVHFTVLGEKLDSVGRVMDFSEINTRLCQWLEDHWDHRLLLWEQDPRASQLAEIDPMVVILPVNPTAELLATYLLTVVGPQQLANTGVELIAVKFEETVKCSATVSIGIN